jgi:hypothetical protein
MSPRQRSAAVIDGNRIRRASLRSRGFDRLLKNPFVVSLSNHERERSCAFQSSIAPVVRAL